jgi:hypothetical protein
MRPDRALWTVGLALAGTVLAGLALNLAGGLTRLSWEITLAVAVLACAGAGLAMRRRRAGLWSAASVRTDGLRVSPLTGGFLLLAAALAGGAVWLAVASANWQRSPGFAQLWLVPAKGSNATLGVRDDYPGRQAFRLTLRSGARTVTTWDLALAYGETWQRTVTGPAGGKLAATLTAPDRVLSVTS